MSHNHQQHIKKKVKKDVEFYPNTRTMNPPTLEPRRDLPLNKIPELLAKITGTFSSTLSSSASDTHRTAQPSLDRNEQLFDHYSSSHSILSLDEILRFCTDLSLEPDSYEILLFCFLSRAKQMYILTREEFLHGLKSLINHWQNLHDLRNALLHYHISSTEEQDEFYRWIYHYGLTDGQRSLTTCNAICLWRLFYSKRTDKPWMLDDWLKYLENNDEVPKTITCDTWTIFPQFARFIQMKGYKSYDDNEAWPCLFDGFVEYQQKTI